MQEVTRILDMMPQRKNLGLFSATISREVMDISWVYQRDPVEITVRPVEDNRPDIQQYRIDLDTREQKLPTMVALLKNGGYERAIAFCNTKNMTDRLAGSAPDARLHLRPHPRRHSPEEPGKDAEGFPGR